MTQFVWPLFGEYDNDKTVARAAAQRSGLTAKPVMTSSSTGSGSSKTWNVALSVNGTLGFWAWRTPWDKESGTHTVIEDADIPILTAQLEPATGMSRHILVVGRWKWIAGQIGGDGQPLGVLTDNMKAAYEIVQGADSTTPSDPSVAALDTAGRPPVVLARIVFPQGGTPSIEYLPGTMLDLYELALKLDGMHRRTGDETHTGKFSVSADPVGDFDVLRKKDKVTGSVKPYASMVAWGTTVPDAWGAPFQNLGILTANQWMSSGTDVQFETDQFRVKMNTAGYYLVTGQTYSQSNTAQHDLYVQIWQRPAGTTGASDVKIHESGRSDNNGSVDTPIMQMVSANAGDWIYFKGIGKRSLWAEFVVNFVGTQQATLPLTVTTPDWSGMAASGQTYPKIITIANTYTNGTGLVAWAITGGSAAGFTTMTAGVMTLNLPSTGSWTLSVQATDALGAVATKTINITLAAYTVIPMVITNGDVSYTATVYPYAIDIALAATGGQPPITWSLVTGADTTLPSAAVSAGHLTGSFAAAGTYKARVEATDSAGTPQVVDKIINITVADYVVGGGGGGGGCFEESEVYVWQADGTGKLMQDTTPGDFVKGCYVEGHARGMRQIHDVMVTDKTRIEAEEGDRPAVIVEGIKCTPGHPFAIPMDWKRSEFLTTDDSIMTAAADGLLIEPVQVTKVSRAKAPVKVKSTLGTQAGSYFVGKTAQGPWFMVHNMKMLTM